MKLENKKLVLQKTGEVEESVVGDLVTYTIKIINEDDIPFTNIILYEVLESPLSFQKGSVKIGQTSKADIDIFSGIPIGTLQPRESKEVSFEAMILSSERREVSTQAKAQFDYKIDNKVQTDEVTSNSWTIKVYRVALELLKDMDKDSVNIGDEVECKINIKNVGDLAVTGILFKEQIKPQVELVEGSVKVEGQLINSVQLDKGILLGRLNSEENININYRLKVKGSTENGLLPSAVAARYRYEFPDGTIGNLREQTSITKNNTQFNFNTFKQLKLTHYIPLQTIQPAISHMNGVIGEITIKNYRDIQTPVATSEEKRQMTGYKLVVYGELHLVVEYKADEQEGAICSQEYTLPFSTFIVLPKDYKIGKKINISTKVDDIHYDIQQGEYLFVATTAFLNVRI